MRQTNSLTKTLKRLFAIFIAITFLFCALFVRLFVLQILTGGELTRKAADQWYRDLPLVAERGNIYAGGGELLAGSEKAYDIYARPNAVTEKSRAAAVLSDTLGISITAAEEKLSEKRSEVTLARKRRQKRQLILMRQGCPEYTVLRRQSAHILTAACFPKS